MKLINLLISNQIQNVLDFYNPRKADLSKEDLNQLNSFQLAHDILSGKSADSPVELSFNEMPNEK